MAGSSTAAGSTLGISAALPANENKAGYEALTFTKINGIEKIGTIGATFAEVPFQPLDGPKETHKGSRDNGSLQPSLAHDSSDAGQSVLRAAGASDNNYAFKVTIAKTGAVRYFFGRSFGYPETIDGADSIVMANPTIKINSDIVKVDTP